MISTRHISGGALVMMIMTILILLTFSITQIDATVSTIIVSTPLQCSDSTTSHCELIFISQDTDAGPVVTEIPGTGWARSAESVLSIVGTCALDINSDRITVTMPAAAEGATQRTARCVFSFRPGTYLLPVEVNNNPQTTFPSIAYFLHSLEFVPISASCDTVVSTDPCFGSINAPYEAYPLTIRTTSALDVDGDLCPDNTVTLISETPLVPGYLGHPLRIYSIDVRSTALYATSYQCGVTATKSIISPYLEFIDSSSRVISSSRDVVFSDAAFYLDGLDDNCQDTKDVFCTLIFEINIFTPELDLSTILIEKYFAKIPDERLYDCSDDHPRTEGVGRDSETYHLWCLKVRKPIETITTRPAPGTTTWAFNTTISIYGKHIRAELVLDLRDVYYTEPVWFEYDDYCADAHNPFCGIMILSKYQGPALTLTFPSLPFDNRIEYLDCSMTDQMMVTTSRINMPSNQRALNPNGEVVLPPGATFHMCTAYVAISYKTVYPVGTFWQIESYQEHGIHSRPIRNISPLGAQSVIGGSDKVVFETFPITTISEPNCADQYDAWCTITFLTYFRPDNFMNWMRSFDVYIPGLDSEYTAKVVRGPKFEVTYSNFKQLDLDYSLELVPTDVVLPYPDHIVDPDHPNTERKYYFKITMASKEYGEWFFEDSSKPTTLSITYRKGPDINFQNPSSSSQGVIPYFIKYAQSPLSEQPPLDQVFERPADQNGFEVFYRPEILLYMNNDCDLPTKMTCRITVRRWADPDGTYPKRFGHFLVSPSSQFKNVQLDVSKMKMVFLDANLEPIIMNRLLIGPQMGDMNTKFPFVLQLDFDTLPETKTGQSTDGVEYTEYYTYYVRAPGTAVQTSVYFFHVQVQPDPQDPTNPAKNILIPDPIDTDRPYWYYEQPARVGTDALPTFGRDCTDALDPFCTITWTMNDVIPADWTVSESPLGSKTGVFNSIVEGSHKCENFSALGGSGDPDLSVQLMSPTAPDLFGRVHGFDWIRIKNINPYGLYLTDSTKPATCTVTFRLNSVQGPPHQRVHPYVTHGVDVLRSNFPNEGTFIPRISWLGAKASGLDDCRTSSDFQYKCTLQTTLYGSPLTPILSYTHIYSPAYIHDVFGLGVYWYYDRILTPEQQNDPAYDKYRAAYLDLRFISPGHPLYVDEARNYLFSFYVLPGFQDKTVSVYHVKTGLVSDVFTGGQASGIYPAFPLPVDLNGLAGDLNTDPAVYGGKKWIVPIYDVPAVVTRPLLRSQLFRPLFSQPGYALQVLAFELPTIEMILDTDLGNDLPLPCISSLAPFSSTSYPDHLNETMYQNLLGLNELEQIGLLAEYYGAIFTDPSLEQVAPVGHLTRDVRPGQPTRTIFTTTNSFKPDYTLSEPFTGTTGFKCYYYTRITQQFPTKRSDVKYTMKLGMPPNPSEPFNPDEQFFFYGAFPRFLSQSSIIKTTTPNHNH